MSRTQPLRLTNPLICNHNDNNGIFIVQTQRVEHILRVLDFNFQKTRYTKSCGHRLWSTYTFESDVLLLIRTWSQESDKSELVIKTDLQEQVVDGWSILFHSTVEFELMMVFRDCSKNLLLESWSLPCQYRFLDDFLKLHLVYSRSGCKLSLCSNNLKWCRGLFQSFCLPVPTCHHIKWLCFAIGIWADVYLILRKD